MDYQLPRVGEGQKGAAGVNLVAMVSREVLGLAFREPPPPDYGIDAHLEILWNEEATGRFLFAQIKTGRSYFRDEDQTGWTVSIPKRTVHYWLSHPVPVLLILVDLTARACYWAHINGDRPPIEERGRHYRVKVLRAHRLDAPETRAALLDLDAGTFVTTRRQFGHLLEDDRPFHHARPLMGRTAEVEAIVACIRERGVFVIELAGRGGIGKTRLMLEVARRVEALDWKVRWLREVVLGPHAGREIPPGPVLLVADDAHLRTDLEALFKIARARAEPTLVLLSFRPWARPVVRSAARAAEVPLSEIRPAADLHELPWDELRRLVAQELGPGLEDSAELILAHTRDSTLVALAAARFLREKRIQPRLLERSDEFRHEVLTRFEDAVLGDFRGRVDREKARALLRLVSVSGPVVPDDEAWTASAASFLGIPAYEVTELLGILEVGEVLSRRAGRLSVTPDLLSDHLVSVALVNEAGVPTRFERHVVRHFGEGILPRLTANLSELEWRLEQSGESVRVLEEVWQALFDNFQRADNYHRLEILHQLRPVAPLQPARVYELTRWLVENPVGDSHGYAVISDRRVMEALVPLLEQAAEHEEWLPRAAAILWKLGRDHRWLFHAERVASLFAYHPQKPLRVQQIGVDYLERLTREPGWAEHAQSPLVVAAVLLKKEHGPIVLSAGVTLDAVDRAISPAATMEVRLRVVALLGSVAGGGSPRGRIAAVDQLLASLAPPSSRLRRRSEAEPEAWMPQDQAILNELERVASAGDPLVRVRVRDGLARFVANHPSQSVTPHVAAVVEAVSETPELALYRAWSGLPPVWPPGGDRRSRRSRERRLAAYRAAAKMLLAGHADAPRLAATLSAVDAAYTAADLDAHPGQLLAALGAAEPHLTAKVVLALVGAGGPMADKLSGLLFGIRKTARRVYRGLLDSLARVDTLGARRSVAAALEHAAFQSGWTAYECRLALHLASDLDAAVRHAVLGAAASGTVDADLALQILARADVRGDPALGDAFAAAAEAVLEHTDDRVDEATAGRLLDNLAAVPCFTEGYAVTSFLASVASRWPTLVIGFVLRRMRLMEEAQRAEDEVAEREERPRAFFRAVPRGEWLQVWDALRASPEYRSALDQVRDATAAASAEIVEELAELFGELARADEQTAESLLAGLEGHSSADAERLLPLLEGLPRGFVFAMPGFVARALEAADAHGRAMCAGVMLALKDSLQLRVAGRGAEHAARLRWERDEARRQASSALEGTRAREFYDFIAESADLALAAREARKSQPGIREVIMPYDWSAGD